MTKCKMCDEEAEFGLDGAISHCKEHIMPGMRALGGCHFPGCIRVATYRNRHQKQPIYCIAHKHHRMICAGDTCAYLGCTNTQPCFGKPKSTPKYCATHRKPGMIDLVHTKCHCGTVAAFGWRNSRHRVRCAKHKKQGMINLTLPACAEINCYNPATRNYQGYRFGTFCVEHQLSRMVSNAGATCMHAGCKMRPDYNFVDESYGAYCAAHKLLGMERMAHPKCSVKRCIRSPIYAKAGAIVATHCIDHCHGGLVCVIGPRCAHPGCPRQARFGPLDGELRHCGAHFEIGEFTETHPRCQHIGEDGSICSQPATHSSRVDNFPQWCAAHGDAARPIICDACAICGCRATLDAETYWCAACASAQARSLAHEALVERLCATISPDLVPFRFHECANAGALCMRHQAPAYIQRDGYLIAFEVDAHQEARTVIRAGEPHVARTACASNILALCEFDRMIAMQQRAACPVVFVRYNPYAAIPTAHSSPPSSIAADRDQWAVHFLTLFTRLYSGRPLENCLHVVYLLYDGHREFAEMYRVNMTTFHTLLQFIDTSCAPDYGPIDIEMGEELPPYLQ